MAGINNGDLVNTVYDKALLIAETITVLLNDLTVLSVKW